MIRLIGTFYAAIVALVLAMAPMPSAQAAPVFAGSGNVILGSISPTTETVRFRGGGGFRGNRGFRGGRGFRGNRGFNRGYYRPYRGYRRVGYYGAPAYYGRPAYYGPRCFYRPARYVQTYYGVQFRPARRVCRY
jgi:hypothetical protein